IHKIIDISLSKLLSRVLTLGYRVELTEKAKDFVAEKGYDPKYGARPLNRAIQKYIEDPIAEEILKAQLLHGDIITADFEDGKEELTFVVSKSDEKPNLPSDERPEEAPSEPENGEASKKTASAKREHGLISLVQFWLSQLQKQQATVLRLPLLLESLTLAVFFSIQAQAQQ
nr:chaperone protein ClpD, chloroplastic [Tanacetum cinerariifolium]